MAARVCEGPGCDETATSQVRLTDPVPAGFPVLTLVCDGHLAILLGALDAWHSGYRVSSW